VQPAPVRRTGGPRDSQALAWGVPGARTDRRAGVHADASPLRLQGKAPATPTRRSVIDHLPVRIG